MSRGMLGPLARFWIWAAPQRANVGRGAFAGVLAFGVLAWPGLCAAMERAKLDYRVSSEASACPGEALLRSAVSERLGYDPFDAAAPELLRASLTHVNQKFLARLDVVDQGGVVRARRELSAPECGELVLALALSMSIVIDPDAVAKTQQLSQRPLETETWSSSEAPAESKAVTSAAAPAPASDSGASQGPTLAAQPRDEKLVSSALVRPAEDAARLGGPRRFELELGAVAHLAFGSAPSTAPGAGLSIGLREARWSVALEGRYDAPVGRSIEPRGRVSTSFLGGALVPCARLGVLVMCGVGLAGRVRAAASSVSDGQVDAGLFLAAGARAGLVWYPKDGPLGVLAGVDGLVSLRPLSAELGGHPVWSTSSLSARLAAGVSAAF